MNKYAKIAVATACMMSATAAFAGSLGTDTSGNASKLNSTQQNSVNFTYGNKAQPVALTNGDLNTTKAGSSNADVIQSTTFTPEEGHTYIVTSIGGVNSALKLSFGTSDSDATNNDKTSFVAARGDTYAYINILKAAAAPLAAGQYHTSYTLDDYLP